MAFLKFKGNQEIEKNMNDGNGSYNLQATLARGAVPDKFYGLDNKYGGSSAFAGVAHRGQTVKQLHNLMNDGVATQIRVKFADENGEITTPFPFNNKVYHPGKGGWARVVDTGKLDMDAMIARDREAKTKRIMARIRPGDSSAAYLFGYTLQKGKEICAMDDAGLKKEFPGIEISETLAKNNICTLQNIKALPPNSITQTHCIAKLNLICEYLADTVHEEELTSIGDTLGNMKDGHNVVTVEAGESVAKAMGANPTIAGDVDAKNIGKQMQARNEKNLTEALAA